MATFPSKAWYHSWIRSMGMAIFEIIFTAGCRKSIWIIVFPDGESLIFLVTNLDIKSFYLVDCMGTPPVFL